MRVLRALSGLACFSGDGGKGGRGGGGMGGVMSKRLKSGSGHHRLEICGPSNGRHKIA